VRRFHQWKLRCGRGGALGAVWLMALLPNLRTIFFLKVKVAEWAMKIHTRPQHVGIDDKYFFACWTCNFYRLTHRLPRNYSNFKQYQFDRKEHIEHAYKSLPSPSFALL
jgi:hypothetical protein